MLDLKRLSIFREVVRHGSFSAAAISLNYSQPAVSHQVARLELELGAQLLVRARSGVTATPAGRALLEHIDVLLERAAQAEAHVMSLAGQTQDDIRLVAFATASATLVADAVAALRARHVPVGVRLIEGDPGDALTALRMRHVDIAIVFDDEQHPLDVAEDLVAEHLLDDPMLLALPSGHPVASQARVALADLRDAEWIQGAGEETPASLILLAACQAVGFEPRVAFNTGNFGVVQELVASGIGVALVPALALGRRHPDVKVRPLSPTTPFRRIWLLHRRPEGGGAYADAMLDALRSAASGRRRRLLDPDGSRVDVSP